MVEKDVVQALQHYRHDLMNDLQIVQGYLSMGKADKAEAKVKEWMEYFNEERKLMSLKAPSFILWVIQFNSRYENFRLSYTIHTENKDLQKIDEKLVEQCNHIMEDFINTSNDQELYNLKLKLSLTENPSKINVRICLDHEKENINSGNMDENIEIMLIG
ncbi:Spo0B domain-containing protein [Virgibacillus profundi]|nr:Spo0B domain-containing protein [Virgibacillus profundi]